MKLITKEDVAREWARCDECRKPLPPFVQLGNEEESIYAICLPCLRRAVALAESTTLEGT